MCHIGGALAEALRDGKPTCSDVAIRHRAGHQVFLRIWATPIRDADGIIIGASESFDEDRTSRESDRRHRKLDEHGCVDQTSGVRSFGYIRTVLKVTAAIAAVGAERSDTVESLIGREPLSAKRARHQHACDKNRGAQVTLGVVAGCSPSSELSSSSGPWSPDI
jgi:hypothetical protein